MQQRSIKSTVRFSGIGLHTGALVQVEIRPANANTGILFCRNDLPGCPLIEAKANQVFDTTLATRLGTPDIYVSTVEHLMAALFAFGIDNVIVSLNNYELPILDGSAAPFLVLLDEAGVQELKVPRKQIKILSTIEVVDERNPERFIRVEPASHPWLTYAIDFQGSSKIGVQSISIPLTGDSICEELSYARTFCMAEDITNMRKAGLARGGSLENAIVVSASEGVLNQNGLRAVDEFVRHKLLDCVGDLALIGMPIMGHVIANKAGHDLHTKLAKKILLSMSEHEVFSTATFQSASSIFRFPVSLDDVKSFTKSQLALG